MLRRHTLLFVSSLLLALSGCTFDGAAYAGPGAGRFGATPGGVQDMGLARALVADGNVPPPEAFVVEGMFSEHDLPVDGGECADVLCIGAAPGIAPNLDHDTRAWLQIGLSSTIDPDTYERPNVTLIATVDVSGSMGWSYGSEDGEVGTPGELSRAVLRRIASDLREADRIGVVTYGSNVVTALAPTSGADQSAIAAVVDGLREAGSTNMEAGLESAFALARAELDRGNQVRVLLFTDEQPNVGLTSASGFQDMVASAASDGIGLTIFGMGEGLGQELFEAMSHLRGGNAFSVMEPDDLDSLMDESWPYLLSPVAYDLHVSVAPAEGSRVLGHYGFPDAGEDGTAKLDVASVFLSRKRGALLLELGRTDDLPMSATAAELTLGYLRPDGSAVDQALTVDYASLTPDARGQAYAQPATARTVALAIAVTGMREAAELYATNHDAAVARAQFVADRLSADAEALDDDDLRAEATFAQDLLELMQSSAPQGSLYGY